METLTGQLGLGDRFMREQPVLVPALADKRVVRVGAGQHHAAAVLDDGRLYTWGGGVFGIGHGDVDDAAASGWQQDQLRRDCTTEAEGRAMTRLLALARVEAQKRFGPTSDVPEQK